MDTSGRFRLKKSYFLYLFLGVVFLFGGVMQILGGASITQTNLIALSLLTIYLSLRNGIQTAKIEGFYGFIFLIFIFLLLGTLNKSSFVGFLVYIYYFSVFFMSIACASISVKRGDITNRWLMRAAPIYLAFQIPICLIQTYFASHIITLSRVSISIEDTASGTFYLASDASLAFFCIIFNIYIFQQKRGGRYIFSAFLITAIIVLLTNSKAMHALFFLANAFLWIRYIADKTGRPKPFLYAILFTSSIVILTLCSILLLDVAKDFYATLNSAYDSRLSGNAAHRLAPIGEFLFGDFNLIGHGFLTYFNPLTKEWLYYSGFSLLYSLYIDCGIIGVMAFYLFSLSFIWSRVMDKSLALLLFFCFFIFSLFNFSITDFSAAFSLITFILLGKQKGQAYA